jgi:hypothetical protein
MEGDVHQSALAVGRDRWQPRNRLGIELVVFGYDAQASRALRDQHAAVRQKCKPPGVLEALHEAH